MTRSQELFAWSWQLADFMTLLIVSRVYPMQGGEWGPLVFAFSVGGMLTLGLFKIAGVALMLYLLHRLHGLWSWLWLVVAVAGALGVATNLYSYWIVTR